MSCCGSSPNDNFVGKKQEEKSDKWAWEKPQLFELGDITATGTSPYGYGDDDYGGPFIS